METASGSYDEILSEYLPWLRKVAGNLTGFGSSGLDDLVQEGYIAMWRALGTHDEAAGPLDYWLKFKSSNRMKTLAIRAAEKTDPLHLDEPVGSKARAGGFEDLVITLGDTIADLGSDELLNKIELAYHDGEVAQAIDHLTPAQRKYVVARFWYGLSGKEMRELGVFSYDPSALWNSRRNGARWKLAGELQHLATR